MSVQKLYKYFVSLNENYLLKRNSKKKAQKEALKFKRVKDLLEEEKYDLPKEKESVDKEVLDKRERIFLRFKRVKAQEEALKFKRVKHLSIKEKESS